MHQALTPEHTTDDLPPSAGAATATAADVTVLIPAYKPSPDLVPLVRCLAELGVPNILVVDDGGGPAYRDTFRALADIPGVTVRHHATNLGKGAALKTGLNHAAYHFPDHAGIVTADADGQHLPDDILRVARELQRHPDSLVLGARQFAGDVPLRSRVGNVATRYLMRWLGGLKLTDTQTGLRGIPTSLAPKLLRLDARGYEFELDMLLVAKQLGLPVREIPIQTVYLDGNASSHFNPLVDSMRIYFVLLRFTFASLLSALIDYTVFALVYWMAPKVFLAQCLARLVSMTFNYAAIKRAVFYSDRKHADVFPRYLALVVVSGLISYALIEAFISYLHLHVIYAKPLAEIILFVANFAISREFIFTRQGPEQPTPA